MIYTQYQYNAMLTEHFTNLEGGLTVVILYFFIGPSEQKNSCTTVLDDREQRNVPYVLRTFKHLGIPNVL